MRPGVSGVSDSRFYKYPNGAHSFRGQMFDGESFRQSGEYLAVSGGVRGVRWCPEGIQRCPVSRTSDWLLGHGVCE